MTHPKRNRPNPKARRRKIPDNAYPIILSATVPLAAAGATGQETIQARLPTWITGFTVQSLSNSAALIDQPFLTRLFRTGGIPLLDTFTTDAGIRIDANTPPFEGLPMHTVRLVEPFFMGLGDTVTLEASLDAGAGGAAVVNFLMEGYRSTI